MNEVLPHVALYPANHLHKHFKYKTYRPIPQNQQMLGH